MVRESTRRPRRGLPQRSRSRDYGKRPRVALRWGRILLALAVVGLFSFALWYMVFADHVAGPEVENTSSKKVFVSTNGTLPGDIFSDSSTAGKPVIDPALAESIRKREELARLQAQQAAANATVQANTPTGGSAVDKALQDLNTGTSGAASGQYAGKDLRVVTAELATHKFVGNTPEEWGEHLVGVTDHLSHVWGQYSYDVPPKYGAVPQKAGKAVAGAKATVALTLDACGGGKGSGYDAELIAFLREQRIPATLFLTSSWMKKNPLIVVELARDPLFEIAAHGTAHKPLSMNGKAVYGIKGTRTLADLVTEVEGNARFIEEKTGKRPRWFRSGTAYYDEVAVAVVRQLGLGIAGYSVAADEGATLKPAQVAAKVLAAKDGDILLLHMNQPRSGTREGLKQALPQMREQGFSFVRLSE